MAEGHVRYLRPTLIGLHAAGLVIGLGFRLGGSGDLAAIVWTLGTLPVLAALMGETFVSLRHGEYGLDIVAALSLTAALLVGETLAAAVVALMYAGSQYLEDFAKGRARHEMTALLARAPRSAMRHRNGGLEKIPGGDRGGRPAPGAARRCRAGGWGCGRGRGADGRIRPDLRGAAGAPRRRRRCVERHDEHERRLSI